MNEIFLGLQKTTMNKKHQNRRLSTNTQFVVIVKNTQTNFFYMI